LVDDELRVPRILPYYWLRGSAVKSRRVLVWFIPESSSF
jgi:hypothetical protein